MIDETLCRVCGNPIKDVDLDPHEEVHWECSEDYERFLDDACDAWELEREQNGRDSEIVRMINGDK